MTSPSFDRALARILAALGVTATAMACGSSVDKERSTTAAASGTADASSQGGGGAALPGPGSSNGGQGAAGGIPVDLTGGAGATDACGNELVEPEPDFPFEACQPGTGEFGEYEKKQVVCYPYPAPPEDCSKYSAECVAGTYSCGLQQGADGFCGPWPSYTVACCYVTYGYCPIGRPFLVDGVARLAGAEARADWCSDERPDVSALEPATRALLAEYWTREALTEHASIASFARCILELLALGAPADLLAAAQRALTEEQEHARTAFAFASAYAGAPVGPGPLEATGSLAGVIDRRSVALSTAREACIAETVAALLLADAAAQATDAVVRAALQRTADEEMAHAALGWRTVAWLLADAEPELRAEVADVFASAADHVGLGTLVAIAPAQEAEAAGHGLQSEASRRRVARDALTSVIAPAAVALLSARAAEPRLAAAACA